FPASSSTSRRWRRARAAPMNTFITRPARPPSKPSRWVWHAKWPPTAYGCVPWRPAPHLPTSTPPQANPTARSAWRHAFPWGASRSPKKSPKPLPGCCLRRPRTSPARSCTAQAGCNPRPATDRAPRSAAATPPHRAGQRKTRPRRHGLYVALRARYVQRRWRSGHFAVGRLATGDTRRATQLRKVAYGATVGRSGQGGISSQRLRHHALAVLGLPRLVAARLHFLAAGGQFFIAHGQVNATVRDIDFDGVAVAHQTDGAAFGRLGRRMADDQP